MIKKICAILLVFIACQQVFAQISLTNRNRHINQSAVYLEAGGTGFIYSVNYEHLLTRNKKKLSLFGRVGIEYLPIKVAEAVLHLPAGFNMILGRRSSNFELGLNALFRVDFSRNVTGDGFYISNPPTRIFFSPIAGYRWYSKPNEYGETVMVRLTFTPLIGLDVFSDQPFVKYWAGISIGKTWTSEKKWKK